MTTAGVSCPVCDRSEFTSYREVDSRRSSIPDGLDRAERVHVRIEKCLGCGLFRTVEHSDNRTTGALYGEASVCFEASASKVRLASERSVSSTDELSIIGTAPPARLLDVGCGAGQWLLRARSRGYEAVGIDLDPRAVDFARNELGLDARNVPLEKLPEGERFDVVTMFGVLEHIEDPVRMLVEARRRITSGGEIVVGVPNASSLNRVASRMSRHDWDMFLEPGHLYHYDISTLRRLGEKVGLRVAKWHTATIRIRGKIPWLPTRIVPVERWLQSRTLASPALMAAYSAGLRGLDLARLGDTVFVQFRRV